MTLSMLESAFARFGSVDHLGRADCEPEATLFHIAVVLLLAVPGPFGNAPQGAALFDGPMDGPADAPPVHGGC